MENKRTLLSLVQGLLMVCMAGCQMLTNDLNVAQAAVEANPASNVLVNSPVLQDELILAGWNALR